MIQMNYFKATDSQIQKSDFWLPVGAESGRRELGFGSLGLQMQASICRISNKVLLLYSTRSYTQYPATNCNGVECICIHTHIHTYVYICIILLCGRINTTKSIIL